MFFILLKENKKMFLKFVNIGIECNISLFENNLPNSVKIYLKVKKY